MYESIIGATTGWRKIEYNWRDVALYALACGADETESIFYDEAKIKTLPTFGAMLYFNAVNNEPQQPLPFPASHYARELMIRESGKEFFPGLHMGHELILYRPIDPIKGTLVFKDTVTAIYDRGPGKGAIVETKVPVYDEAGNLICENISTTHMQCESGYGGPQAPRKKIEYPARKPDYVVDSQISKIQNVLYRLTGDTNREHVDVELIKKEGFGDRLFMQGLASVGFAARMAIKAVIPDAPERMKRISAQMRSICYLGIPVQLQGWKTGDTKMIFKFVDMESGKAILDNCEFEWQ